MDKAQFKQRIVGAVVLVALGVIFIPMILNRDDSGPGISDSNLPEKPPALAQLPVQEIPPVPAAPPPPPETRQLVDEATPKLPPASATPPAKPASSPEPTAKRAQMDAPEASSVGWVVQVASFSDRSKALALRDRLRKRQYTSFVESITNKSGTLYRVRVGPVTQKDEAARLQKQIGAEFKIRDTLVMAHP